VEVTMEMEFNEIPETRQMGAVSFFENHHSLIECKIGILVINEIVVDTLVMPQRAVRRL
jgi:hypothetical protein